MAELDLYKVRMMEEYNELKDKYNKLHRFLNKHKVGKLAFEVPQNKIELMTEQKEYMGKYLNVLEARMELEGIEY